MHSAPQQPASPVRQQIPNVHQNRRGRVVLGAGRHDGDRRPGLAIPQQDLQTRLAAQAEEEGQSAVVGVGARADVVGRGGGGVGARRVAEEAQDGAGGPAGAEVCGCEEGGWVHVEADAEEGGQLQGEVVAEVAEGAGLGFVGGDGGGDVLLGFAVDELAEVEGSAEVLREYGWGFCYLCMPTRTP